MLNLRAIDNAPVATYLTALAFEIVLIVGAVIAIVNPDALDVTDYLTLVALAALPVGLAGIGRGINEHGRQRAGADALRIAHEAGHEYPSPGPSTPRPTCQRHTQG